MMSKQARCMMTGCVAMGLLLFGAVVHAASAPPPQPAASGSDSDTQPYPRVRVVTSMGNFEIELYPDRSPLTVWSFLRYVREGQYTNTLFHRVIANFVIQGGGHDATTYKLKPIHGYEPNESGNGLQNKRGWVGLARATAPHTGSCQFYINLVDNPELDPVPTRWGYAVFGKVVEGMDVVDRIGVTPTGAMGPFKSDAPLKPVVIEQIEIVAAGAPTSEPPVVTTPNSLEPPPVLSPK